MSTFASGSAQPNINLGPEAETFDNRGEATLTDTATSGGGTVDFSIVIGFETPDVQYLRIVARGNTVDSDVQLFRDAARSDQIYQAINQDMFTSAYVDTDPWPAYNTSNLENRTIYGTITNNGGNDSQYDIEMVARV